MYVLITLNSYPVMVSTLTFVLAMTYNEEKNVTAGIVMRALFCQRTNNGGVDVYAQSDIRQGKVSNCDVRTEYCMSLLTIIVTSKTAAQEQS